MKKLSNLYLFLIGFIVLFTSTTLSFASGNQTTAQANTQTLKKDGQGFFILETNGYLNTTESSTIVLPISFDVNTIDGFSMISKGEFVPVEIELNKNIITITPSEYLKDGNSYSIYIFTNDGNKYVINLKAHNVKSINFSQDTLLLIPANPEKGFNYPYYLRIPKDANKSKIKRLIVEPNNTGQPDDTIEYHMENAKLKAIGASLGGSVSEKLRIPVLVPIFPRPLTEFWDNYYHTLSRDVMLKNSGDGKRVDLQLIAMIKDAQELLAKNGLKLEEKVFMTGFSASGQFVNRFTVLHPEIVKAVFHGGFTMYPTDTLNGNKLTFPLGTADIKEIAGKSFNLEEYKKVAQFVFTGDLDTNDIITASDEDYSEYDAKVMYNLYKTHDPMTIWKKKEQYMNQLGFGNNIQFHIYEGEGHNIPSIAFVDALKFFVANNGDKITKINAYKNNSYWNTQEVINYIHEIMQWVIQN